LYSLAVSPARAGSFNANFSPETLDNFKALCKEQSRQYTKVLEKLAELYLGSGGEILNSITDQLPELRSDKKELEQENVSEIFESIEELETLISMNKEDLEGVIKTINNLQVRIENIEQFYKK
tara:strand:+ start:7 stop:375 length:369 start_codon:yes stop_codon:yes gene_type:complete